MAKLLRLSESLTPGRCLGSLRRVDVAPPLQEARHSDEFLRLSLTARLVDVACTHLLLAERQLDSLRVNVREQVGAARC